MGCFWNYIPVWECLLRFEIVELLISFGADVNVQDMSGRTALYHAAAWGHTEIVEILKAAGAEE